MQNDINTDPAPASPQFVAYQLYEPLDMPIYPAPIPREWMDQTSQHFAYRCLPLTIANQAGWFIGCGSSFSARWNGGPAPTDTTLVFDETPPNPRITSLFGSGVITFNMPFLFRTPSGVNLWVKGPTNSPKDAVYALEGLVETDWTSATFTMNWKLTRPDTTVRFERGEPICMIVPVPRGMLEQMDAIRRPLADDKELQESYQHWSRERDRFHELVEAGDAEAIRVGWQKDYFQGRDPDTERYPDHQTKMKLRTFRDGGGEPELPVK